MRQFDALARPSIPCPHIRTRLTGVHKAITLELAVIAPEHVGEFVAYAFPLVAVGWIADDVGVLHRLGDSFVVTFGELVAGR